MRFDFNFYSSLLLIFFFHGIVYAFLLLRKAITRESAAEKWLAFFLLLCSLYISPWMLGFAGWYDNQPYRDLIFYIPFQHLFIIGPVIFFYVQALLNPSFNFRGRHWYHFLPGLLYLLYNIGIVVTDKLLLKRYYFLADFNDREFDSWYQLAGLLSMVCYLVASLYYYALYRKLLVQVISDAENFHFRWIRNFLFAFLLMLLVRATFFALSFILDFDYWSTWWYYLWFAIVYYYIAIMGYANSIEARVAFSPDFTSYRPFLLLKNTPAYRFPALLSQSGEDMQTPGSSSAEEEVALEDPPSPGKIELTGELLQLKLKIEEFLTLGKAYEDPELSLGTVAKAVHSNLSVVSKVINQGFGMNFNDLVNEHRVRAVIELFREGEQKNQTILGIAFQAGFNSKATFNRAFRKITGKSPRNYLDSVEFPLTPGSIKF